MLSFHRIAITHTRREHGRPHLLTYSHAASLLLSLALIGIATSTHATPRGMGMLFIPHPHDVSPCRAPAPQGTARLTLSPALAPVSTFVTPALEPDSAIVALPIVVPATTTQTPPTLSYAPSPASDFSPPSLETDPALQPHQIDRDFATNHLERGVGKRLFFRHISVSVQPVARLVAACLPGSGLPESLTQDSVNSVLGADKTAAQTSRPIPSETKVASNYDAAAPQAPIETFLLPEPAPRKRQPMLGPRSQSSFWSGSRAKAKIEDNMLGEVTYSAFPGLDPVDISMAGAMDGRTVQTHIVPSRLLTSNTLDSNTVVMSEGGSGIDVGGNATGVPDASGGIRLFEPVDHKSGVAGLGLYQSIGASGFSLVPGVDTEFQKGPNNSTDLALTADSSLRLTQRNLISGWNTQSFVGWSERSRDSVDTLSVSRRFNNTTIFQNVGITAGNDRGYVWNQGLSQHVDGTSVNLASSVSSLDNSTQQTATVGLLRPAGRNLVSLRYYDDYLRASGQDQHSAELSTNLVMPSAKGSTLIVGDTLFWQSAASTQHQGLVSDSWQVGKIFDLTLGVSHDWGSGSNRLNGAIGVWATPQWEARLLFGPSETSALGQSTPLVFGFQVINRFDLLSYESGTVSGTVLLDGQPATQPIKIHLDDSIASTDANGKFKFSHVLVGDHIVGFNVPTLPADISATTVDQLVTVVKGKTVDLNFTAQRVGEVTGTVVVDPDAFGQVDPTAGLGIVITDGEGHDSASNADKTFEIGDLPIGHHTISIVPSSLPPGYAIVGQQTFSRDIVTDVSSVAIVFHIAPQQKVDMTSLSK